MVNPIRAKKVKKLRRIRKWKKRSVVILSIFVFLIAFLSIFIYTSLGVKLTTYTLNKVMPELKIEHIDGAFNDLTLKGFSLDLQGVHVKVDEASLSLSGLCLLKGQVCIKHFDASDVSVIVNTNEIEPSIDEPEPEERFILKMPLPIELRKTHLTNIDVKVDDMQFGMSDFQGKAIWVNEKLYVYPSVAQDLKAIFADHVSDSPASPTSVEPNQPSLPINETINQLFNKPLIDSLPQVSIPLDINVESLTGNNWLLHIGGQDYTFNNVTIKNDMVNNHIMVKQVEADATSPYASGHALVSGEIILGDDWPVSATISVKTPQDQLDGQFSGKLLGELATTTKITGVNQVDINAKINFIEKYLPVMADLKGKHIQWPIVGQAQYQLNDFGLSISGTVQKYQLSAKGAVKGEDLPDTAFDILGNGTNEAAVFDHAIVKLPQGDVNVAGKISWLKALQWDTLVKIDNVDLSKELPTYPIKLNGQIQTNGSLEGDKWQADISKLQLKGNIKRADFSTAGAFSINSDNLITANDLAILWGKNRIAMNGSTQKGNLTANLNLAALSLIADDMKGTIEGDIKMSGTVKAPTIDTHLNINAFAWQTISVAKANLTGNINYQDQVSGKIAITGQHIELPSLTVDSANIDLSGNESSHTLTINIDGTPVSLSSSLTGHIDKDRTKWTGNISQTILQFNEQNRWQLSKALPLSYDITKQIPTIGAHCWQNNGSSICLDKALTVAANNETSISLKDIDLAKLPIPNDGETKLAGNLDGKATIRLTENSKIPVIKLNIASKQVYVQQMVASQTLPIPFDLFTINADINQQQAKLDWKFSLNEFGKINGNLVIDDPTGQKRLNGRLVIDNLALAMINPLLESNDYAKGAINGNIKFSGTLLDPSITGGLDLKHSEIKSSQLPADIESAMIDMDFHGKSSTLKGILKTKAGDININGKASWQTLNKWKATLSVNGAAMEVTVPPMVVMTVVPDIKIEATQDQLTLTGKVNIPKGKITVESLPPSSIDVSSDEVMLDKNRQEIKLQEFGMKINSNLEITIGDKVMVDAFGLKAALKGNLLVLQDNKGLGVHGQILIPMGRFHAYGQDLIIRKGEITFSGPTDQPMLNIEAIRNPESMDGSVTAGIRVTGLADDPKIEIFSDPTMSQQEALSYLLRGQGLDSGEQSDNDMMTALLVGLGTAQSGKYVGDIGNVFGIKNLSLDTQGAGNSSKVVVSGYILPNLQLKYGVGIFDSLATFTLRYRLFPRFYLEAASGLDQTLDLIYQFEF